jgi:predicted P-loop ATPase
MIRAKDAAEQMIGAWIIELSELDAVTRAADVAHVKAFITRQVDRFRPSYRHRVEEHPRQAVFAGTVNNSTWNRDDTGARRFWPLACKYADFDGLALARDQLLAEACKRYEDGELWWLETGTEALAIATDEQAARSAEDPWEQKLRDELGYLSATSTSDCLKLLGIPIERQGRAEAMRVGTILRHLGFARKRFNEGTSFPWKYVKE